MYKISYKTILYILSILCGVWFILTGWIWSYAAALIISYPIAIIGFLLWLIAKNKDPMHRLQKVTITIYYIGFTISILSFILIR